MYVQAPQPYVFLVPHALALASEFNLIFVADRENGRVVSFHTSNGTFHKEYRHPAIGTKVYSVAYAKERLYLVNGPDRSESNIQTACTRICCGCPLWQPVISVLDATRFGQTA